MQNFVDLHSLAPLRQLFLQKLSASAFCFFQLLIPEKLLLLFFQMIVQRIFCDLAEPHTHITVTPELVYLFQSFKKRFLCHFLNQRSIL